MIAEDPLSNPDAPPGPSYMPEYHNSQIEQGTQLNEQAAQMLEAGTAARNVSDNYIRTTVVLASVLFLLAIAQRFRVRGVRIGVLVVSGGLLVYGVVALATFRRL